ncbi:MAG: 23S rRNA (uracil1939-C5)-methyltransferase [Gammaproteobacteria bacterium]|jgi:23S rRNA (uracil1939-C5)-methyltransferase
MTEEVQIEDGPPRKPKRGLLIDVRIDGLDRRGHGMGVALFGTRPVKVRVRRGLPGSLVRVRMLGRRKGAWEGQSVELLEASADQVDATCAHFGSCGGCSFQHLAYPAQLRVLADQVQGSMEGLLDGVQFDDIIGAESIWNYRNKMDFTFASRRWVEEHEPEGADRDFALGLHVPERFQKVLDIHSCKIHFEQADGLLESVREVARRRGLPPWDCIAHKGLLRHLVLRKGMRTGEVMVNLVTSSEAPDEIDPFVAELIERHPEITTFVQNINTRPAATSVGEWERVLHGSGVIQERVLGLDFTLSANSFFQTNTEQCDVLFKVLAEEAGSRPEDVVYDLYCGTGAIGLSLARGVRQVYGWETVAQAVTDAAHNARQNGIDNALFMAGDVLDGLAQRGDIPDPDIVVLDPPRSGLHPKVIPSVMRLGPRRIVYVSCNIHAAAEDIPAFKMCGYDLTRVRPIDLFPHTPHVETVLTLERRS